MAGRTKVVAEGSRAPELRKLEETPAAGPERPLEQIKRKPGVRIFRTGSPKLAIMISAPEDPRKRGKTAYLSAFKDFETSDKEIIESLEAHPRYGFGQLFWSIEQEEAAEKSAAEKALHDAASVLAAHGDPGAVQRVLKDLGLSSFPLGGGQDKA